jgi:hypothetical protein
VGLNGVNLAQLQSLAKARIAIVICKHDHAVPSGLSRVPQLTVHRARDASEALALRDRHPGAVILCEAGKAAVSNAAQLGPCFLFQASDSDSEFPALSADASPRMLSMAMDIASRSADDEELLCHGKLEGLSLHEAIATASAFSLSQRLDIVANGAAAGCVCIARGAVESAEAAKLQGEEALSYLASLKGAAYRLIRTARLVATGREEPFRRVTRRVAIGAAATMPPKPNPSPIKVLPLAIPREDYAVAAEAPKTMPPLDDDWEPRATSTLERRLAHIDFFEQAVIVNAEGDLVAALGAETEHLQKLAVTLSAVVSLARDIEGPGSDENCEFSCEGRTLFGVHAAGLFALVAPTRRSITKNKLHALRNLLIAGASEGSAP